jgi:hypothetical protein
VRQTVGHANVSREISEVKTPAKSKIVRSVEDFIKEISSLRDYDAIAFSVKKISLSLLLSRPSIN